MIQSKIVKPLLIGLVIACAGLGVHWYTLMMPGRSYDGKLPELSLREQELATALRTHVEAVASRPHNTSHPAELEASAQSIEQTLIAIGYTPRAQVYRADGIEVRNIEVVVEPKTVDGAVKDRVRDDVQTLVVGAHYDSAGNAPGANDNGSGVAALLEMARALKDHSMTSTRLRFVFFVNEEPPHFHTATMGSLVYAGALIKTGENIRGMLSLETLGSYSDAAGSQMYPPPLSLFLPKTGNFVAFVGTLDARSFVAEVTHRFRERAAFPSLGGVAPGNIDGITWSDHWAFSRLGIPAMMITDTALFRYPHYHLPSDTPDKLDYARLARVTLGLITVVRDMAK
jgi:Peptidase family M28